MPNTKLTIINAAMARAGHSKQLIEGDTAPEWGVIDQNYDLIVGEAFEEVKPNFGKGRKTLTARTAGDFGFNDKWALGEDVMHIIEVFVGSDYRWLGDWESDGEYLYIDRSSADIQIEYIKRGGEARWSSTFANAVVMKLAALIESSINEEDEAGFAFDQMADFKMMKAGAHSDVQQAPKRAFRRSYLMNKRLYGSSRFTRRVGP